MVLGVFRSPDRRCRIEVVRERGVQRYRAWRTSYRLGDCRDLAGLEAMLRMECGVAFADLVED